MHPHGPCFCMGNKPSPSPAATSSPGRGKSFEGRVLGKEGRFRPYSSTAERIQLLSCKLFALAKASPFWERWHGEAVTERVASGTNPLSRLWRQLSRRESPWQRGQVSSLFVNGRRSQPISGKRSAFAKASPFRERWHGEAVTERVCFRDEPSQSRCARQLSRRESPWQRGQVSSSFVNGRKKPTVKL